MGQSTLKPDRKFLDYPYDISELADRLGIEKFGVMGWSGGGPHTVVCAYEIPERLLFNIALCGYTNFAELPGAAGMFSTKVDQVSVEIAKRFPRMYHLFFSFFSMSLKFFPNLLYKTTSESLNDSDKEIMLDPAFKTHFLSDQREAIAQGTKGVMIDSVIHYDDWGFRLKEITSKVHVFHGTEDKLVPIAFGRHLAENIPNCDFHVMENQGHMFPISHQNLIFATAKSEL